jgi:ATP synthase protein I
VSRQPTQYDPEDPWLEPEEPHKVYSKGEMQALVKAGIVSNAFVSPWKIVTSQIVLTILSMAICVFFLDDGHISVYTYSAFWGGLIGFLPSALFVLRLEMAKRLHQLNPGKFLAALVSGEFIKIALTVLLFIGVAYTYPEVKWVPLLLTYLATLKCVWLAWFWK